MRRFIPIDAVLESFAKSQGAQANAQSLAGAILGYFSGGILINIVYFLILIPPVVYLVSDRLLKGQRQGCLTTRQRVALGAGAAGRLNCPDVEQRAEKVGRAAMLHYPSVHHPIDVDRRHHDRLTRGPDSLPLSPWVPRIVTRVTTHSPSAICCSTVRCRSG